MYKNGLQNRFEGSLILTTFSKLVVKVDISVDTKIPCYNVG